MQPQKTADIETTGRDVLDQALLDQYRARNNLLQRLIDVYLEEAPGLLKNVLDAASENNLDSLRTAAHTLKSSSHNLGAMRLAEMCQDIETAATSGDEAEAAELAGKVGPEFFEVEQALKSELYALSNSQ